jgi:hypothetical protein
MRERVIDLKGLKNKLGELKQRLTPETVLPQLKALGQAILADAVNSPVPVDAGLLMNSATMEQTGPAEITIGFNKVYSAFQDQGSKTGVATVRPKRKKWLFIPLTAAAEKNHRPGGNPKEEGLIFGGFFNTVGPGPSSGAPTSDYVLAKKALIKINPYGSDLGPNHYFSQTWKNWVQSGLIKDGLVAMLSFLFGGTTKKARKATRSRPVSSHHKAAKATGGRKLRIGKLFSSAIKRGGQTSRTIVGKRAGRSGRAVTRRRQRRR